MKKNFLRRVSAVCIALAMLSGCGPAMDAIEMLQSDASSSSASSSSGTLSGMLSQAQNASSQGTLSGMLSGAQLQPSSSAPTADDPVLDSMREMMVEFEYDYAVALVNYVEGPVGDGYLPYIEEYGYLETCPFMADCEVADMDGSELYCIIPRSEDAGVAVYEWSGDIGSQVFCGASGEPILLRGDLSDPDAGYQVCIVEGDEITDQLARPLLENGMLIVNEEMMDFTYYDAIYGQVNGYESLYIDEALGGWISYMAYDGDGNAMTAYLNLYLDENGATSVQYWYKNPDDDKPIEEFSGFVTMEDAGCFRLEMELTGGTDYEKGKQPYSLTSIILAEPSTVFAGGISVSHVSGDALIPGAVNATFEFENLFASNGGEAGAPCLPIEALYGEWITGAMYDATGAPLMGYFNFFLNESDEIGVEYWYGYPEGDIIERFEGTVTIGEFYEMEMELVGGIAMTEGGTLPYIFTGTFLVEPSWILEDGIAITHVDGDTLIFDAINCTFEFERLGAAG